MATSNVLSYYQEGNALKKNKCAIRHIHVNSNVNYRLWVIMMSM